mmetsp:Transcript_38536/g.99585  ORF Transcript_38536/g.99585 Transcript_38536/m.99585 type:complete len:242 (-) Transcript_38536:100-825(-)
MAVVYRSSASSQQFGWEIDDARYGSTRGGDDYHRDISNTEPIGPEPGDLDALADRLRQRWNPEARVAALRESAMRNGGLDAAKKARPRTGDPAIDILEKVFEDGAKELNMQPGEVATVKLLRGGMRDFVDYALDEVDRVGRMQKSVTGGAFAWRNAGNPDDNPCLRRSLQKNHVGSQQRQRTKREGLEYLPTRAPPPVVPASFLWPPPHLATDKWGVGLKEADVADSLSPEANRAARFSVV